MSSYSSHVNFNVHYFYYDRRPSLDAIYPICERKLLKITLIQQMREFFTINKYLFPKNKKYQHLRSQPSFITYWGVGQC